MNILVLGAGELGLSVLRALSQHHLVQSHRTHLSVLLRPSALSSPTASQARVHDELRRLNVSLIPSDIVTSTVSELSSSIKPFDAVIGCMGFGCPAGTQVKIARAVLEAGVKRYIPWQFGIDYDVVGRGSGMELFDEQLDVRGLLRGQKGGRRTGWTVISTEMFMSFLFEEAFGVVTGLHLSGSEHGDREGEMEVQDGAEVTVHALGSWDNAVTVTAVEDIGRITAEVAMDINVEDKVVYTAGETIGYARLANVVDAVTEKTLARELYTTEELGRKVKEGSMMDKYRLVFAKGKGVSWSKEESWNGRRGMQVEDVRTWLERRLGEHMDSVG